MSSDSIAHRSTRSWVAFCFTLILGLSVLALWFVYLRPVTLGGSASYVIVNGPSMQPTL